MKSVRSQQQNEKLALSTQKLLALGPPEMHTRALLIAFLPCVGARLFGGAQNYCCKWLFRN
jgi:hypothetical protein